MVTILDPNSTPMVKSCTRWNLLSVNCNNRHDFPTPEVSFKQDERERERERKSQTSVFYDFEEPALSISNGKE
jgi:hypothetical protein